MKPVRKLGFYPMSIATSLAFEGISHTGDYNDRNGKRPVDDLQNLMINVRTLIRNIINGYTTLDKPYLSSKDLHENCLEDIDAIYDVMNRYNPACKVTFYISSYKSINAEFKNVNFRKFDSGNALLMDSYERSVVKLLEGDETLTLEKFDYKLRSSARTTILTHHPIDLLSYYSFPDLSLLESHTGVIKERNKWATKLNTPKGCTVIPFNRAMLCIFGDKSYIGPQDTKVKKVLVSIGEKYAWNSMTTIEKQLADIKRSNEMHLANFVAEYK